MIALIAASSYHTPVNSRHRKTLERVFADPVSGTIGWSEIELLFVAVGCRVVEGAGSRVRFEYRSIVASFHRPHPQKDAKRYQVRDAREFLVKLGVKP
jgi:HicA-like toxin of HicAB toxin-antitoxin system